MLQRQLLADYKEDICKYVVGMDQTRITQVFEHIPVQLAKDNRKFQISKVAKGTRFGDYRGCIEWLKDAGLVNVCHCLNYRWKSGRNSDRIYGGSEPEKTASAPLIYLALYVHRLLFSGRQQH